MNANVTVYIYKNVADKRPELIERREMVADFYNDPFDLRDFDEVFSDFMNSEECRIEKELDKEFGAGYGYGFRWE